MPLNYKDYHPKWRLISRLIRFNRANNKCEKCGVPNHSIIERKGDKYKIILRSGQVKLYVKNHGYTVKELCKEHEGTYVVLTVAHIDHDKTNNRFWNLAAWCQRCHLLHDIPQHIANRKYGRNWKENQTTLEL